MARIVEEAQTQPLDADAPGSWDLSSSTHYFHRDFSPKEASSRLELEQELMGWSGCTVTVKGLKGAASVANGVFALPKYVRSGVAADGQPTGGALSTFCRAAPTEAPTPCFTLKSGNAFLYVVTGEPKRWVIAGSTNPEVGPIWAEARLSSPSEILPPESHLWQTPSSSDAAPGSRGSGSIKVCVTAKRSMSRLLFEGGDSSLTPPEEMQDALDQIYELPRIVERLITVRGLTIVEAQKVLLPMRSFHVAFASRSECFEKHGFPIKHQLGTYIGDSPATELEHSEDSSSDMPKGKFRAARWVELLDGSIHARLMNSWPVLRGACTSNPPMPLDDEFVVGPLLRGLRHVLGRCLSTPELAWALPARYSSDQVISSDHPFNELRSHAQLGHVIRFLEKPLMAEIKPAELAANGDPDSNSKTGFFQSLFGPGQSQEALVWVACKVTKKDPVTLAIQVDRRPGYWLSLAHQGACLRVPSDAE